MGQSAELVFTYVFLGETGPLDRKQDRSKALEVKRERQFQGMER